MTRIFQIDVIALPLLFIPLVMLVQVLLALQLYNKLNKKDELFAAVGYGISFIIALGPFSWATGGGIEFWSKPFHWSLIAVVLALVVRLFITKQLSTIQQIAFGVVLAILFVTVPLYAVTGGSVAGIAILLLSIFLLYEHRNRRFSDPVIPIVFLSIAVLGFVGQWFPFNGGRFLFGFLLLATVVYEIYFYVGRIMLLLQAASINSVTDSLTGLYNQNFLLRKANKLAEKQEVEVLHVEINDFPLYMKEHGQEAGYAVLKELGSLFREVLGENGYACHSGEQYFIGIIHMGNGEELAGRLQRQIAKRTPVSVKISFSRGKGDISTLIATKKIELAS